MMRDAGSSFLVDRGGLYLATRYCWDDFRVSSGGGNSEIGRPDIDEGMQGCNQSAPQDNMIFWVV